jgi:hypothetical protein
VITENCTSSAQPDRRAWLRAVTHAGHRSRRARAVSYTGSSDFSVGIARRPVTQWDLRPRARGQPRRAEPGAGQLPCKANTSLGHRTGVGALDHRGGGQPDISPSAAAPLCVCPPLRPTGNPGVNGGRKRHRSGARKCHTRRGGRALRLPTPGGPRKIARYGRHARALKPQWLAKRRNSALWTRLPPSTRRSLVMTAFI